MSLDRFIRLADSLVEFEASLNSNEFPVSTRCLLDAHIGETKSTWERLRVIYEQCLDDLSNKEESEEEADDEASEIETVKQKYRNSYSTYCRIISKLTEALENMSNIVHSPSPSLQPSPNNPFHLPPIELPTFHGDYRSWPTFRDMFSAVCIRNSKLCPVEKLFHLSQKTKGEAHEIVAKSPLTNDGFQNAWSNLCARYENKRVLVNEQLKILFSLPSIPTENAASLKRIQRDINGCISTLNLYSIDVNSWNPIFIFLCSNCLPDSTLTLWEQTLTDKAIIPQWSELDRFLTNRHRTLESVLEVKSSHDPKQNVPKHKSSISKSVSSKVNTFQTNISHTTCKLCSNEFHVIRKCPKFLNMDHGQRLTEVKNSNLCLNCFSSAHLLKNCKSKNSCFKCKKRHNTLLHKDNNNSNSVVPTTPKSSQRSNPSPSAAPFAPLTPSPVQSTSQSSGVIQNCFATNSKGVLLGTALVKIIHLDVVYTARVLIDSGSEGTFVSERWFNLLKLPSTRTSAKISGLNNILAADVHKECRFTMGSFSNATFTIDISALVVPHLSNNLPSSTIHSDDLLKLPELVLADPKFYESSKIDILLGADVLPSIMLSGCRHGICGSLMAQETVFGWILTGPIGGQKKSRSCPTILSYFCEISIDQQISRFWEVEKVPQKKLVSESEKFCEDLYEKTTTRDHEGRYVVFLPFKEGYSHTSNIGNSRNSAMAQFLRNEKRLLRDPQLKKEYDENITEYLSLQHMIPISPPDPLHDTSGFYLPHHAVVKPDSTTTKVRLLSVGLYPDEDVLSTYTLTTEQHSSVRLA
ncbi:uncharacterized protein LOC133325099 [Musca vetustissima]|uniref:uncharacterized protein LOC133325099 n=1 Tax=Musca vetustissima TaxID=27455 RepID=UPI002AB78BF0|nr:uncharacterized protein LOC133325099 [Musca vetustissima]